MILYNLIMETAFISESKKVFINIPTVEEVCNVIGINERDIGRNFEAIEMLIHGAPFTWIVDSVGSRRDVQKWFLKAETYHQGEHAEPVMDPKAWEEAYRRQKLKVVDLEVQLAKLRANWVEFSGAISECYNKAFGYQMEMYQCLTGAKFEQQLKHYKPKDEDRDRFYTLLNYLDPAMVDPKTIHND